jgi:hypothetical protein
MGGSLLPIPWVETDVFFVPHMVVGAVSLQPAALQDGDAVHLAGIGSSSKLASSLLVDSDSIHAAIAAVGAATIAPVVFSDTDLLYVSALVPGGVGLSAGHVDDSESFMVSTVAPQAAFLQPHAYQDVGDIPAPGLIQGIGLDTLRPAWLFDIDKISRPTVTGGKKPVSKPPLYGSVSDQNLRGSCKSPAYMIGSVIPNALLGSGKSPAYMIGSAGSPKLKGSTRDAA